MAIKKDITDARNASPAERNNVCWSTFSRQRHTVLRIELHTGQTWLLPYAHWFHVNLRKLESTERLSIRFASHDVQIEGFHLREVLLELQANNVEVVRELPPQFPVLTSVVAIHTITIVEAAEADAAAVSSLRGSLIPHS
jgi:hypothetical protein